MEIPYTLKVFHSTSCYCRDIPPIPICIPLRVLERVFTAPQLLSDKKIKGKNLEIEN